MNRELATSRAHAMAFNGMAELLRLTNNHGGDLLRAEHALREALQIIETLKEEGMTRDLCTD